MAKKKRKIKNKTKKKNSIDGITVKNFDIHIKNILTNYPANERDRLESYFTLERKKIIIDTLKDFHKVLEIVLNIETNELRIAILKTMKLNIEQALMHDKLKDLEKLMKGRIVNIKKLDNMEAMEFLKKIFG